MSFTIKMSLARETKGALRYHELDEQGNEVDIGDGAKIGVLYIRKSAMAHTTPQKITVSVEV